MSRPTSPMPGAAGSIVRDDDGLEWYRIDDVDGLAPFLVTLTAPHDQWTFVSSSGALTAGRRDAGRALFPYETDDRLHRSGGRVGPVTVVRVGATLWEPFAPHVPAGVVRRSLSKTLEGDRLCFEEHHPVLGLTFRSTLTSSRQHGLVRSCELALADGSQALEMELLDGYLDVLPAGVELALQQATSTLVDAYRRSELDAWSGAAMYALEAAVSDHTDPAESLRANLVWSRGLEEATVSLSDAGLRAFRSGVPLAAEHLVTGRKGAFLQAATVRLDPGARRSWTVVADVHLDHVELARRVRWLTTSADPVTEVTATVAQAHEELVGLVAAQDGLQRTGDRAADGHHLANVLFNAMRGGALLDDHRVRTRDVVAAAARRNTVLGERLAALLRERDEVMEASELRALVADAPDVGRLVDEYLPLTFGRRHGDPSRPWNSFRIVLHDDAGERVTAYEGNWRDIFQNWEALLHSHPGWLPSVVAKFLNASTRDGHNPYRIDQDGVDWELPDEGSWGNFGYWGDHQLVYLLRLLEAHERFHPGLLAEGLDRVAHSYADVPYRLLPYEAIVKDPKHTLAFDVERQREVEERVAAIGTDGRLVPAADGGVHLASLAEKLLVPALAKLSNLVPGGGVWMNTQRPEWNDANNALVGNGLSVVTAFHLRDYLAALEELLRRTTITHVPLDPAVHRWISRLAEAFTDHRALLDPDAITPTDRRALLDRLGLAYEELRTAVYDGDPATAQPVAVDELRRALEIARAHVEVVTSTAERGDDLVDSYRVLVLDDDVADVRPLQEMLEGQVAHLGRRGLSPQRVVATVDALFASPLYAADRDSFMLQPDRRLPPFLARNHVPEVYVEPPLRALLDDPTPILRRDVDGVVRFSGDLRNARELTAALATVASADAAVVAASLEAWEATFDHHAFTGRSQTMHRYEGLGSVYWHMVVKLLLALQERLHEAIDVGADPDTVDRLVAGYRRVRDGLGHRRTAADVGSFPLDPHSHTPAHAGAQQPGMTGATKEGVLVRLGELGVRVREGRVLFRPVLLTTDDLLTEPVAWGPSGDVTLEPGTLGFTYCGVPVAYHATGESPWARVTRSDGTVVAADPHLDRPTSSELFARRGSLTRIDVGVTIPGRRDD